MSNPFNKKNNSSVLRSFAKIAADKNLVSFDDDKLTKKASAKEDLYAGENLIENILKLANALRNRGNVVQSEELERLALQYKAASNQLYQVFKETGEDLVDLAHPEGSAKLEGVAGDAVVETIVDQKKKIEEIVKKSPTGKLAMVRGEIAKNAETSAEEITKLYNTSYNNISNLIDNILSKEFHLDERLFYWGKQDGGIFGTGYFGKYIASGNPYATFKDHLKSMKENLSELRNQIPSGENFGALEYFLSAISSLLGKSEKVNKEKYQSSIFSIQSSLMMAKRMIQGEIEPKSIIKQDDDFEAARVEEYEKLKKYYKSMEEDWIPIINLGVGFKKEEKQYAIDWINQVKNDPEDVGSFLKKITSPTQVSSRTLSMIKEFNKNFETFYNEYIK